VEPPPAVRSVSRYCQTVQTITENSLLPFYISVLTNSVVTVFTVRHYALHGLCDRNSVCPSVCRSVTLVDCVHMVRPTIMISSPYDSPITLVSGDITCVPKFEGDHPERGR